MTTLTARAKKAIAVLTDGGEFAQRLERDNYTGREQFAYRLENHEGYVVRGFGGATFYELKDAGMLKLNNTTSVSSYYGLKGQPQ
jgi:hypothetical protein